MPYILSAIVLALLQVFFFNRIQLFDVATPYVYVYQVLISRRSMPHWLRLILCFLMALWVDIMCNTPGLGAAAITLVAFLQPYVLELFLTTEDDEDLVPSIQTLGWLNYVTYSFILISIFCLALFGLEAFCFAQWQDLLVGASSSMLLTLVLVVFFNHLRRR